MGVRCRREIEEGSRWLRCPSPHRPRFRADLGTLAAFARLPGGHRVRTLTPLLMSEAFASNISTPSRCVRLQTTEGICRLRQGGWWMEGGAPVTGALARRRRRLCAAGCPTRRFGANVRLATNRHDELS